MSRILYSQLSMVVLLLCSKCLIAQTPSGDLIVTDDARPMERLAERTEQRFHTAVTYEDPKWTASDLLDAGDLQWKLLHPGRAHQFPLRSIQVPAAELMAAQSSPMIANRTNEISLLLSTALSRQGDYGSKFTSTADDSYVHIIPRNGSPLDFTVTVSSHGFVTAYQALDLICKELSRGSGSTVVIGTVPINYLNQHVVSVQETGAKARQALMHILGDMRWKSAIRASGDLLSWKLMYAFDGNLYVLNLNGVTPPPQAGLATSTPKEASTTTSANSSRGVRVHKWAQPSPRP